MHTQKQNYSAGHKSSNPRYSQFSSVAQSCLTLCNLWTLAHQAPSFMARILEWVAISFSMGSSQPRDQTQVSHIAGTCFNL